jgi:hypothetical protein
MDLGLEGGLLQAVENLEVDDRMGLKTLAKGAKQALAVTVRGREGLYKGQHILVTSRESGKHGSQEQSALVQRWRIGACQGKKGELTETEGGEWKQLS